MSYGKSNVDMLAYGKFLINGLIGSYETFFIVDLMSTLNLRQTKSDSFVKL